MKKIIIILFMTAISLLFKTNAEPDYGYGGNGYFYSALAPYGSWIQIDGGINVWRPVNMNRGWVPYKYGRWIWTDDGWYWDSDEPFGYIVFHYGRWYYDDYYGWIWIPDNQWAPAWVEWRYDNDYIGWAPLPPYASFSINFGIRFTTSYSTPYYYWHFLKYRYMCNQHAYRYFVPDNYKYRIYSGTKYRTNYGYSDGRVINRGVDVDYIRNRSGVRIMERNIERVDNPRDNGRIGDRNSGTVRAFIIPRDQMESGNDRNVEIKRGNRASSLDLNRIEIGRSGQTGNFGGNDNRNNAAPNNRFDNNNGRIKQERNQGDEYRSRANENQNKVEPRDNNLRNERNYKETPRNNNSERSREKIFQQEKRNNNRSTQRIAKPEPRRENLGNRNSEPRREAGNNRNERRDSGRGR